MDGKHPVQIEEMHDEIIHSRMSKGVGNKNVQNRTYTSAINITGIQVMKPIHGTIVVSHTTRTMQQAK